MHHKHLERPLTKKATMEVLPSFKSLAFKSYENNPKTEVGNVFEYSDLVRSDITKAVTLHNNLKAEAHASLLNL